jgi:hypothetical protein
MLERDKEGRLRSCRELSLVLEMAVEDNCEEMARKEFCGAKKTSCVIWGTVRLNLVHPGQ